ncbi:MAG: NAD-dependent epimerase/dehydratase family protein [Anaerolineales bacterium]|nr:NAD-dependent epimerase/dehydratase family protein [Anaerolineales bacterium]
MKILVTGATGLLGYHLCRNLVERGHRVTALWRASSNASILNGIKVDRALGDVTDSASMEAAARGQAVVIHAAAHLAYWSKERDVQNRVNIEGTRNVVAACQRAGVQRLIFVSSIAAVGFPARGQPPADESFPFNLGHGKLNYAITKKRGEEIVLNGCKSGLDAVIVNPATLFGELGEHYRGSEWVEKIRNRRLASYYSGGRNLVHVEDVVNGMVSALERGKTGERYILGGENLTYKEVARKAAERLGKKILLIPVPPAVTGILSSLDPLFSVAGRRPPVTREVHFTASQFQYFTSAKAEQALGYTFRPYSEIIEDILNWHDQRTGSLA